MTTLAIVSPYKSECGIAVYAECLEGALHNHFEKVDVFALDTALLRSHTEVSNEISKKFMDDLCEKLKSYDVVNLQYEPGTLGRLPPFVLNRLKKMTDAAKKLIVTVHTFPPEENASFPFILNLRKLYRYYKGDVWRNLTFDFFRYLKQNKQESFTLIVHTQREKRRLLNFGIQSEHIIIHPLLYLSSDVIKTALDSNYREKLEKKYDLKEQDVLVGFFGFIAKHKGLESVLKAMSLLPENYRLLIFGSIHPASIKQDKSIDPYLNQLIETAKSINDVSEKIIFCGSPNNDDFPKAIAACDRIVLPYLEIGQNASGPASMALQLKKRLFTSNNHCFKELLQFAPGCFELFDIGNYIQLSKELSISYSSDDIESNLQVFNQTYTLETLGKAYRLAADVIKSGV